MQLPSGVDTEKNPIDFFEELNHYNMNVSMDSVLVVAWGIWKDENDLQKRH